MGRATTTAREPQAAREDEATAITKAIDPPTTFATASHADLFADANAQRCDVCEALLARDDEDNGVGLYVWARGADVRREEVGLCASCSGAIFASVMFDFEIDDEE